MDVLCRVLLALFSLGFYRTQPADFQQSFWREVFTVDVVAPGASLSTAAHTKNKCILHCLQLEDCKTSAFHQHSATCWLYRHLVEYTTTGMASNGTRYFWRLSPSCPGELGYQLEAGMCFKVYTIAMNWTTAEETCWNDGGHLVIADTAEKRTAILNHTSEVVRLGASDADKEGERKCKNDSQRGKPVEIGVRFRTGKSGLRSSGGHVTSKRGYGEWRWVDGSLVETNNWRPGEPNNFNGSQNFLRMHLDGRYNDVTSYSIYIACCQIHLLQ